LERKKVRIWVVPEFKRDMKEAAAKRDTSILNLTESLSKSNKLCIFEDKVIPKKREKRGFFDELKF
jgi:hypothetical protein